jgi:flagellar hook assembly protein FlgD
MKWYIANKGNLSRMCKVFFQRIVKSFSNESKKEINMKFKTLFRCVLLATFLITAQFVSAQYVEELYSPFVLSSGVNTASIESPVGDIYNPAASGGQQRTTIDLSAILLPDFSANMGIAGNLGITIPTNFAKFSASGHFISSPYSFTNTGIVAGLNVSMAKDLFRDLYVGVGLQLITGSQSGSPITTGGGLDLGFLHFAGNLLFMQDFRWGIALRGIGYGYTPSEDTRFFPRDFTSSIGANFKLVNTKDFVLSFSPDVSIPLNLIPLYNPLLNFKVNVGTEVALFDTVFLHANVFNFDLLETLDAESTRWPLDFLGMSFGLSVKYKLPISEKIEGLDLSNQTDVKSHISVTPIQNNVWGLGIGLNVPLGIIDNNPPAITIDTSKTIYISPNNDGVQDEAVLPISITDERFVSGYKFTVTDSSGAAVKTIANKDPRPENYSFENFMNRLGYVQQGIAVPASLDWNGRSDQGALVADGTYNYTLEAWDDNGNTGKSPQGTIVIDNTAPVATVKSDYLIFSPNNDGNKDTLKLNQQGSSEDKWIGTFTDNAGNTIATSDWANGTPAPLEWDGKTKDSALSPDGVYAYRLSSTDRAGNTVTTKIDNIIINTQTTPININIGLSEFSPNADGVKDQLRFNFFIPVQTGIEKWNLAVEDKDGKAVKTFTGTASAPEYLDFDGKGDAGNVLPEGTYKGTLTLLYQNGNNPTSVSPEFRIDVTKPKASVNANQSVFSPNGDGNKDTISFSEETSEEQQWTAEITDTASKVVKSYTWKGKADTVVVWDGRNTSGALVPDGKYNYALSTTDKAGNSGESNKVPFEINTEDTPVLLSMDVTYFSPNGDNSVDTITFLPSLKVKTDVEKYNLTIKAKDEKTVRAFNADNKAPEAIAWNGKDDAGKTAPDGEYKATLNILYKNGNNPVASTNAFYIDTVAPSIEITAPYIVFSPDGDGSKDTFTVDQISSEEDLWEAAILGKNSEVIRSFYWKGKTQKLQWDGKTEEGNKVPDGLYTYRILTTDRAGNKVQKEIRNVELDTKLTPVFLTVESAGFSPNEDKFMDTIDFKIYVENQTGIKSWKLEIAHTEKGIVRIFGGTTKVDATARWDGNTDKNTPADEGIYSATLSVEYVKGNIPTSKTQTFILDRTAPALELKLKPIPFSPDNDGIDDDVTISPVIRDISDIAQWNIEVFDPMMKHFIGFTGKGMPQPNIKWDGFSDRGIPVESATDYPVTFTARDAFGNNATIKSVIPVDILLIKIGNNYKIRIPSITFKPFTDDYVNVETAKYEVNMKTLKRLAVIFNKYSSYGIRIEGYALSLNWADAAKAKVEQEQDLLPLSKKRADAIKKGLGELGIEGARIETVGLGGLDPVVPHGDQENNWKNRRVEFILIKNK